TTTTPLDTSTTPLDPTTGPTTTSSTTTDLTSATTTTTDTTTTTTTGSTTDTTDTTSDPSTTTGEFMGCLEPTDSDTAADPSAWARQAVTSYGQLDVRHMEVDHTGAVLLSNIFHGLLDLGGAQLDGTDGDASHHYLAKYDALGQHAWSLHFGGSSFYEYELALDCAGNLFLAGSFDGSITIEGVTLTATLGFEQEADIVYNTTDILLAKFTPAGQLVWARRFGDASYQRSYDLVATDDGGVVIAGALKGTLDVDGTLIVANTSYDGLLLALDATGAYLWHRSFAAPADVDMQAIDRSAGGQLSVAGGAAAGVDFGGGPLPADNQNYIYLAQFEANGDHRWSLRAPADHSLYSLAADDDAAVYIAGYTTLKTAVLTRFDPSGALAWTRTGVSTNYAVAYDVSTAGTTVALIGSFRASLDLGDGTVFSSNTGFNDLFLARYAADGALLSASQVVSGKQAQPRRVRIGPDGETLAAGFFKGTLDLPTGQLTAVGSEDMFLYRAAP
ncbi:MAG: hypothetical protein JNK56_35310, partial [Myxococcales bacterium]|nr:hypothetical protein [Myxococcales bacterium]